MSKTYKCRYPHCGCKSKDECIAKRNAKKSKIETNIRKNLNNDDSGIGR